MSKIFGSAATNAGIGLGGAAIGGGAFSLRARQDRTGPYPTPDLSPWLGAIAGAVAAPVGYHIAKPFSLNTSRAQTARALLKGSPTALGTGVLFGGAAVLGAAVGGALTSDPTPTNSGFRGLESLPGLCVGAIAGPPALSLLRGRLGASGGAVVFAALAAGTLGARGAVDSLR